MHKIWIGKNAVFFRRRESQHRDHFIGGMLSAE
jgi:hypothetical protein